MTTLTAVKTFFVSRLSFDKLIALCISSCVLTLLITTSGIKPNPQCEALDLDCSWVVDAQYKLLNGQLSGRDYAFTYGPLSQIIFSIGLLANKSYLVVDGTSFLRTGPYLVSLVLLVLAVALVRDANWKTSVVILFISFATLDSLLILRPISTVIAIIVMNYAVCQERMQKTLLLATTTGLVCFLGQLITFEIGTFALVGAIIIVVVNAVNELLFSKTNNITKQQQLKKTIIVLITLVISYTSLNLIIDIYYKTSSPTYTGFFDYQYYNLQMMGTYAYTMTTPWVMSRSLGFTIIGIFIYSFCFIIYNFRYYSSEQRSLYISLLFIAFLQLKSMLVRNDEGHVLLSITPLVFLFLLLAYNSHAQRRFSVAAFILVTALALTSPKTGKWFDEMTNILANPSIFWQQIAQARSYTMRIAAVLPDDFRVALSPNSSLILFPYENIISVALNRSSIAPVLQPYSASNSKLQNYYINNIQKVVNAAEVVYCTKSSKIDNVDYITRSSLIFEYLLEHFNIKQDKIFDNGCTILQPRQQVYSIPATLVHFQSRPNKDRSKLSFSEAASCTLLRLKITVVYPIIGTFGRTTPIAVRVMSKDVEIVDKTVVPIDVGQPFIAYIYLGDESGSYTLFNPKRTSAIVKQIDAIELRSVSFGPFDVHPRSVKIESVECINLGPGVGENIQP